MRNIDEAMQQKVLAVARAGMTSAEAIGFFRVSLGLYYLAGLMTQEELDFKKIDAKYNRFIYHTLGGGHSIASVLQYMSGEKVLRVLESPRFLAAFGTHCPDIPIDSMFFLDVAEPGGGEKPVGPGRGWPRGGLDRKGKSAHRSSQSVKPCPPVGHAATAGRDRPIIMFYPRHEFQDDDRTPLLQSPGPFDRRRRQGLARDRRRGLGLAPDAGRAVARRHPERGRAAPQRRA